MRRKRSLAALLALCCLLLCGCSETAQQRYERGQMYLGYAEYAMAEEIFRSLGNYGDAESCALYAAARGAMASGEWSLAERTLRLIHPFAASGWCLDYLAAHRQAQEGMLTQALAGFEALGAFLDSEERAQALRVEIPRRELAQIGSLLEHGRLEQAQAMLEEAAPSPEREVLMAQCRERLQEAAYGRAEALAQRACWAEAMAAFDALGDYRDSPARVLTCRSALYRRGMEGAHADSLTAAAQALEDLRGLDGYLDSARQAELLEARWGTNLRLLATAEAHPYAVFGSYPLGEHGAPAPVLWQVAAQTEEEITLLACRVLDAMSAEEGAALPLVMTPEEQAADPQLALPEAELIEALFPEAEARRCPATPYAMAQGVRHHQDGSAWYFLSAPGAPGYQQAVWYNGAWTQVAADYAGAGIRPVLRLSLSRWQFTQGDGTAENPFR